MAAKPPNPICWVLHGEYCMQYSPYSTPMKVQKTSYKFLHQTQHAKYCMVSTACSTHHAVLLSWVQKTSYMIKFLQQTHYAKYCMVSTACSTHHAVLLSWVQKTSYMIKFLQQTQHAKYCMVSTATCRNIQNNTAAFFHHLITQLSLSTIITMQYSYDG